MNTDNLIIGLAGPLGCGKSTAAMALRNVLDMSQDIDADIMEVSDFVRTEYEHVMGDTVNDNRLGEWAAEQKVENGAGCFVERMVEQSEGVTIISGIRSPAEAEAVYEAERDSAVAAVWSLPHLRFERKYDAEYSDPEFRTFMERSNRELHEWGCKHFYTHGSAMSDYVVPNNDTMDDLRAHCFNIVQHQVLGDDWLVKDITESPFPDGMAADDIAKLL
jgi:dephospho-CoA kinase